MGNNPVGKKVNTPKVNTWVNTFLRKYPGCLKVNTGIFLLLVLGFYLNPTSDRWSDALPVVPPSQPVNQ